MKINLADYPPGCDKPLVLKQDRAVLLITSGICFLFSLIPAYFLFLSWSYWDYFFVAASIEIFFLLVLAICIFSYFNPEAGYLMISENGINMHYLLGKSETFHWVEIHNVKLELIR